MAILCVFLAVYMLIPGKKPAKIVFDPQDNAALVEQTEEDETKEASAELYDLAYKKGFHAFKAQYDLESPEVVYKYTSQIEEHGESEKYHELIDRGYVDGYHKAAESGICPR